MSVLFAGRSWSCKERSRKRDPDNKELQLELLRKQAEQQVQISVVGKWGFWDNRGSGIETKEKQKEQRNFGPLGPCDL